MNTKSVNSYNISDKLKFMQIKDIMDDDLVADILCEKNYALKIQSQEQTLQ